MMLNIFDISGDCALFTNLYAKIVIKTLSLYVNTMISGSRPLYSLSQRCGGASGIDGAHFSSRVQGGRMIVTG